MKAVTAKLKERGSDEDYIKSFQTAANKYSSKILANFKNYDQYQGSSSDPEGMLVLPSPNPSAHARPGVFQVG